MIAAVVAAGAIGLPDCLGKLSTRPAEVVLACGDANFGLRKLHWTGWGGATVRATGTAYANDCKPYCAAGRFHAYPAVLVASGRQTCRGGAAYARVRVTFPGKTPYPKASKADLTYPRRCG